MDKGFWQRTAFLYDFVMKMRGDATQRAANYVAGFTPKDARMLDAACGTGAYACALAPHAERVEACDYASSMVNRTRAKVSRLGLSNVACREADIMRLPYEDAAFDMAVAASVLHLLDDPAGALHELMRVVRPGGVLALPNYVNAERDGAEAFVKAIGTVGFKPAHDWTASTFLAFLEGQGLVVSAHEHFEAKQPLCVAIVYYL